MRLSNFKIGYRLTLMLVVILALMVGVGSLGVSEVRKSHQSMVSLNVDRVQPLAQLSAVMERSIESQLAASRALQQATPEAFGEALKTIATGNEVINSEWKAYASTLMTDEENRLIKEYLAAREIYLNNAFNPLVEAIRANDLAKGKEIDSRMGQAWLAVDTP